MNDETDGSSHFRLHGGDNVQIKRYFVSFWNGVDLRYKLLKGPKIRISIAGIIISRVKNDKLKYSILIYYNQQTFFSKYINFIYLCVIEQKETIVEDESCNRGAAGPNVNNKIVLYPGTRRDTVLRKESRGKRRNRLGSRSD